MAQWLQLLAFLTVCVCSFYLFVKVVYHRYLYMKLGRKTELKTDLSKRIRVFGKEVFGQTKLLKDRKSGWMHLLIFYGFIILQLGALDLIVKGFGIERLPIPGYDVFVLVQEITVLLVLLAIGYAAYRRYGEKLPRLKRGKKPSIVIYFIVSLMISVYLTLTFERVMHDLVFSAFAPISSFLALPFINIHSTVASSLFYVSWWLHLLILLAFLIYVPQSKHFHLLTAPVNIFLKRTEPVGKLSKLDFEDENAESFGVSQVEDFSQKQLLDFYACVECGRCTNVCPATNTGKLLSPMHLITKMRDHLTEKGAAVTSKAAWVPASLFQSGTHSFQKVSGDGFSNNNQVGTSIEATMYMQQQSWSTIDQDPQSVRLIGDVMTEEEIWACTTCRNCEDQCPVDNEHVDKIVDLRRHLLLMEGKVPFEGQRAMQNIERQGNPWGLNRRDRENWLDDLDGIHIPTIKENPHFDILYFVGSMGSYDTRSIAVSKAFVRLLDHARVNVAILGNEEKNSGDTPRRMGNELLFQELCQENIATFQKYHVKTIVTTCPHTYHTFKNEYPDFGLKGVDVLHHTELLEKLVREGKLTPTYKVDERITYHDSCYLGRYNAVYEQPRNVLRAIEGVELIEMERHHDNAMCCGAGGGMMWMEESVGQRVNVARTEQALKVNPTVVSSACPYCLTMIEDGTKQKEVEEIVKARDIAEILELAVFGDGRETNGKSHS
ncbi:(Fe-S)-binding protein [Halalkalibacter sp. APA_J-10(15)]|uniref:(Fe-S)-binding protein n=1 Tax=unclassified Halalkalibacter TaxID=2893063 RepID=UPI001FF24BA3|nr:(Fe-S)-binding protein [Halalkalibacter sp. APA_J-10(15)]MCK0470971.1 (Fe-S)-binding protein [Halalkalibacter sp. APA_J-10(15)]